MKAIRLTEFGGPEKLKYQEVPNPVAGSGQAVVKLEACGVNFIDIYQRSGLYKIALPATLGLEGCGVVTTVGAGVTDVKEGDKVAFAGIPEAYASMILAPADRLVVIPRNLSFHDGAAAMLQGMTAHYLSHSVFPLKQGDRCLIHAAGGGVGQLLCQIAKMKGAQVFGTVSTDEKADLAKAAGADAVIRYDEKDFEVEMKRLTGGKGVHVVYDSVGKTTFEKSLGCLVVRGTMVLFGQSSGPVPPVDLKILNDKGALYLTRPSLAYYTQTRQELLQRANDIMDWISKGKLKLKLDKAFPLAEAAEAHRYLEGRQSKGKILLLPG